MNNKERDAEVRALKQIFKLLNPTQRRRLKAMCGEKIDLNECLRQTDKTAINIKFETPPGAKIIKNGNIFIR